MKKLADIFSGVKMTALGGVFLALSFANMLSGNRTGIDFAWASVVICGFPLLYKALSKLFLKRKISTPLLVSTAMAAALYIGEVFAAGEVAFIMAVGEILEKKTIARARRGIKNLISLAPTRGRIIMESGENIVPVCEIKSGDILRVLPGESIPVDGKIISGSTSIDQSIMTGESLPVDKGIGDEVFCGTINRFGSIDIRASKVGKDSSFEKLIRMVKSAEENKSPTERIADKWASILIPVALAVAIIAYAATGDISRAVTILVVFCPCSLVLATPTSIMAAIGQAAKYGVIIKSGAALEKMGAVDCFAFDKTGTLTIGKPSVSDIVPLSEKYSEDSILSFAASAESLSEHPLGKSISEYARNKGLNLPRAENFSMAPGRGIKAKVGNEQIICGNSDFMRENSIDLPESPIMEKFSMEGKATIMVAISGKLAGIIALSDSMKADVENAIRELKEAGAQAILLTGDNKRSAEFFAQKARIDKTFAELLPAQKVQKIEDLRKNGFVVSMVGDGVNDAPALKTADVGVAMGSMGSDIAVEASDIAIMGDDIAKVPYLKRLSNAAVRLIKFNISLSMTINFIAIILSLYAVLTPVSGALVHNAGSLLVVINAALLYDRNYMKQKS